MSSIQGVGQGGGPGVQQARGMAEGMRLQDMSPEQLINKVNEIVEQLGAMGGLLKELMDQAKAMQQQQASASEGSAAPVQGNKGAGCSGGAGGAEGADEGMGGLAELLKKLLKMLEQIMGKEGLQQALSGAAGGQATGGQ